MIDYHPYADEVLDDPYPVYRRLRDDSPAHYLEEFDCWFLSRFADVWKATMDAKRLSNTRGTTPGHLLTGDTAYSPALAGLDPPGHTRARSLITPHFKPGSVARLESVVRERVRSLLDEHSERGAFDVNQDFAARVSILVACTVGGLPLDEVPRMAGWVNDIFHREPGHRGLTETGDRASKDMFYFLLDWVKQQRGNPDRATGVLQTYLTREVDGALMPDMLVAANLALILIGGTETFPKAFSNLVYRLWQHPEQRARLAADPSGIPDAFHEALRYDTPTQMLGRTVVAEASYGGASLRPGQKVMFLWASANRDEREFDDPDRFDVTRRAPRMLAFGNGTHLCIGAHAARLEARVGLEELLRRFPDYEVEEAASQRMRTEFVRGFASLPIRVR